MSFAAYLDSFVPGSEPDPKHFEAMWEKLEKVVKSELQRRGLYLTSPRFLGITADSWDQDAFQEFLADCYLHVFVRRVRRFRDLLESARVEHGENAEIGGAVRLSIRYFIHDLQRLKDPIGHRIYVLLRRATRKAVRSEELWILSTPSKIEARSILGFAPDADAGHSMLEDELRREVSSWGSKLLPELVEAVGKALRRVAISMEQELHDMARIPIEAFVFGHLIGGVRFAVRTQWAARWKHDGEFEPDGEGTPELIPVLRNPMGDFFDREEELALRRCIEQAIERLPVATQRERNDRDGLKRLWSVLRVQEKRPSERALAEYLDIKRTRLRRLLQILREIYEACVRQTDRGRNP